MNKNVSVPKGTRAVKKNKTKSSNVVFHYGAVVYPISNFNTISREFDGGVVTNEGTHCPLSVQVKGGYSNKLDNELPPVVNTLKGRYLYAGMMQNRHFGHFLIESLSRLWASTEINRLDGIVFILRSPEAAIAQFATDIIKLLIDNVTIYIVREPTQFSELIVPEQICQPKQGILTNHPVFGSMFGRLRSKFKALNKKYPSKVYVSRSKLMGNEGQILAESILEASLVEEGYVVIHPQELNINEQLFYYTNADKLIFADGSAFHLYVLVANEYQSSFIVWRRKKHHHFDMQLRSFISKDTYGKPCLLGCYTPEQEKHNSARHKAKLDFFALKYQMIKHNFINGETWIMPTDNDYLDEITVIEKRSGKTLVFIENSDL